MNWKEAQQTARDFRAVLKAKWPSLTDEDLQSLERHKDVFLFRLQRRVGGELRDLEQEFDALIPAEAERSDFGVIFLQSVWSAA